MPITANANGSPGGNPARGLNHDTTAKVIADIRLEAELTALIGCFPARFGRGYLFPARR
jgi:hypothetical protein